ncbi:hypothetical protein ABPG75_006811 [Micractinium tetrahymenae]
MEQAGSAEDRTAALPDDLLAAVVGLAGQEAGPSTTLVCKRWHLLFWEEGSAWQHVTLNFSQRRLQEDSAVAKRWLRGKQRLLARVALHVRALALRTDPLLGRSDAMLGSGWPPALLRQLLPDRLLSLHLDCCHNQVLTLRCRYGAAPFGAATCQRLSRLQSLHLDVAVEESPSEALASLGSLTALALESLTLRLSASRCSIISRLSQLTSLHRLRQLAVVDHSNVSCDLYAVQRQLSRLPLLAAFEHRTERAGDGCMQFGRENLAAYRHLLSGPSMELELQITGSLSTLQQLLEVAVPPGVHLTCLRLLDTALWPDQLRGCSHLAQLSALELKDCRYYAPGGVAACLSELLTSARQLTRLVASRATDTSAKLDPAAELEAVPASLAQYQGLRELALVNHDLHELPAGTVWKGLEVLDLCGNRLARLPPALDVATALTCLVLAGNPLAPVDVKNALERLPALRLLSLSRNAALAPEALQDVLDSLPRRSSQLTVEWIRFYRRERY